MSWNHVKDLVLLWIRMKILEENRLLEYIGSEHSPKLTLRGRSIQSDTYSAFDTPSPLDFSHCNSEKLPSETDCMSTSTPHQ